MSNQPPSISNPTPGIFKNWCNKNNVRPLPRPKSTKRSFFVNGSAPTTHSILDNIRLITKVMKGWGITKPTRFNISMKQSILSNCMHESPQKKVFLLLKIITLYQTSLLDFLVLLRKYHKIYIGSFSLFVLTF